MKYSIFLGGLKSYILHNTQKTQLYCPFYILSVQKIQHIPLSYHPSASSLDIISYLFAGYTDVLSAF